MTIEEKIEKMERQISDLKWFSLFLITFIVLCLGALFIYRTVLIDTFFSKINLEEVRVKQVVIEDKNGTIRALLGTELTATGLTVFNPDGEECVILGIDETDGELAKLILADENNKGKVVLKVNEDERQLSLSNSNGNLEFMLSGSDTNIEQSLYGEQGNQLFNLDGSDDEISLLLSPDGSNGINFSAVGYEPEMRLTNQAGMTIWTAP